MSWLVWLVAVVFLCVVVSLGESLSLRKAELRRVRLIMARRGRGLRAGYRGPEDDIALTDELDAECVRLHRLGLGSSTVEEPSSNWYDPRLDRGGSFDAAATTLLEHARDLRMETQDVQDMAAGRLVASGRETPSIGRDRR